MKPVDVNASMYIDFNKENNKECPKFKVDDHVRISKYKNIFAKDYVPNWSQEISVIKKIWKTVPWIYFICHVSGNEIVGKFYKKESRKTDQKKLRVKKVIKRESDKLSVKWKGHDNLCNSWIDKKDMV